MRQVVQKILILSVILLLGIASSYAQRLVLSAGAGLNFSKITGTQGELRFGYYLGGFVDYRFTPQWVIHSGVSMSTKGTNDFLNHEQSSINAVYLEIPVMAKRRFILSHRTTLSVGLGPYFSYGMAGDTNIREYSSTFEDDVVATSHIKVDTFKEDVLKEFDMGMGVSFGIEHKNIEINVGGQYGLANLANKYLNSVHNQNISVGVVYRFYSKK